MTMQTSLREIHKSQLTADDNSQQILLIFNWQKRQMIDLSRYKDTNHRIANNITKTINIPHTTKKSINRYNVD